MKKLFRDKENSKDIYMIISNLNRLYRTGIPIVKAMDMLKNLPISVAYKISIEEIGNGLKNGISFYNSFSNYPKLYSKFFLTIIKIGEDTGELIEIFYGLEIYYKSINLIKNKIIGVIIYPSIILMTLIVTMITILRVVIPNIQNVFISMNQIIPKEIEFMMKINVLIDKNPISAMLFIISWILLIPSVLIIYKKECISNILRKFKVNKIINEFIFIVLLKMIFKSGINLSTGIKCCAKVADIYDINYLFNIINQEINKGNSISEAMISTNVFKEDTIAYIKIGEESGNINEILELLEKELFNNINLFLGNAMQWIQPFMIVMVGGLVTIIISKIILPIMNTLYGGSFL